jgi:hypothetical protein
VHVNFGQSGFVFIEANVKKWGLAPQTGSLAPPPPYGSEQGSILLEGGRRTDGDSSHLQEPRHGRTRSGNNFRGHPTSPGPIRSPTDISLAHLAHIPSNEDFGEGTSQNAVITTRTYSNSVSHPPAGLGITVIEDHHMQPPPEYSSPRHSPHGSRRGSNESDGSHEGAPLLGNTSSSAAPPIPSYSDVVAETARRIETNRS